MGEIKRTNSLVTQQREDFVNQTWPDTPAAIAGVMRAHSRPAERCCLVTGKLGNVLI
jgi:hypothetical protein